MVVDPPHRLPVDSATSCISIPTAPGRRSRIQGKLLKRAAVAPDHPLYKRPGAPGSGRSAAEHRQVRPAPRARRIPQGLGSVLGHIPICELSSWRERSKLAACRQTRSTSFARCLPRRHACATSRTRWCCSTVDDDGQPSGRFVLLKAVDERGFVFYTNLQSRKALALRVNPRASLCAIGRRSASRSASKARSSRSPTRKRMPTSPAVRATRRLARGRRTKASRWRRDKPSTNASPKSTRASTEHGPTPAVLVRLPVVPRSSSSGRAMPHGCTCANATSGAATPGSGPCSFPESSFLRLFRDNPTASRPVRPPGDGNPAVGPSHLRHC